MSANDRTISFTVRREDYPREFLGLGVTREAVRQGATNAVGTTFTADAPDQASFYGAYFTEVQAFLGPSDLLAGVSDTTVDLRITKGSTSQFIPESGSAAGSAEFQHAPTVSTFDYFSADCSAATRSPVPSDLVRYSPYGLWTVQLQTPVSAAALRLQRGRWRQSCEPTDTRAPTS